MLYLKLLNSSKINLLLNYLFLCYPVVAKSSYCSGAVLASFLPLFFFFLIHYYMLKSNQLKYFLIHRKCKIKNI